MAAFDQLREEFDRLSKEEQLGLSIQGLFSTYRQGDQRSNQSLFNKDTTVEADLSKRATQRMTSQMSSQMYRVRISNVLGDIVEPLGEAFDGVAARDRIHRNSLHHESTLYQQGIIDAVKEQGQENRTGFIRSTMLGYERFKRDPLWASLNVLGKVLTTTLKTSWAILFGRDKRTVEEKMLDELKKHTEYYKTGSISKDGFFERLGRQGVLGMLGRRAISEIATGFSWLFPKKDVQLSEKDIITDTNEKTTEILSVLHDIHRESAGINESVKLYGSGIFNSHLLAFSENGMMSQLFNASMNYQMSLVEAMSSMNQTTDDMFGGFNEYRETWKDYQEQSFDINQDVRDELVEHNKREKRRTFMGIIGGIFSSLKGMATTVAGFVTKFPALMTAAVAGAVSSNIGKLAGGIASAIGGTLKRFFTGRAFIAAVATAIRASKGALDKALKWGATTLGATGGAALAGIGAMFYSSSTSTMADDVPERTPLKSLQDLEYNSLAKKEIISRKIADLRAEKNNTQNFKEKRKIQEQINELIREGRNAASHNTESVSGIAMASAQMVNQGRNAESPQSAERGRYDGLLKLIRRTESDDNYNALVYGKKGRKVPGSTNLTDMSIEQVMDYQKGMLSRGHASTAVGGYQIIKDTLADAVKKTKGVDKSSLFDRQTQDKLTRTLIDARRKGSSSTGEFADNLSKEWASLPYNTGRSYYDGTNQNRSSISRESFMRQVGNAGEVQSVGRRLDEAGKAIASGADSAKKKILDVFSGGNMGGGGLLDKALEAVGINTAEANAEKPAVITKDSMQAMAKVMEDSSMKGFSRAMEAFEQSGGTVQISGDLDD